MVAARGRSAPMESGHLGVKAGTGAEQTTGRGYPLPARHPAPGT